MRTINYKGFELDVEVNGDELLINNVDLFQTGFNNQIALLNHAFTNDVEIVSEYKTELDYKYMQNGCYMDVVIDIPKWFYEPDEVRQKVLIELLMLEENEIMEQIGEVV